MSLVTGPLGVVGGTLEAGSFPEPTLLRSEPPPPPPLVLLVLVLHACFFPELGAAVIKRGVAGREVERTRGVVPVAPLGPASMLLPGCTAL